MPKFLSTIPIALGVCYLVTAAAADDWTAQKLRGQAFILVQGTWVQLKRGDVVSNSAAVRTMKDGQVEFIRDHETIALGPDTQIQIFDRKGQRYTTVKEAYGSVRVEANVENVQHFSVLTPFLAATVKGTIFTVVSNGRASEVQVQRGKVGVDDLHHGLHVDVHPGQSASAGRDEALQIAGKGELEPVVNATGKPVVDPSVPDKVHSKKSDNATDGGDDSGGATGDDKGGKDGGKDGDKGSKDGDKGGKNSGKDGGKGNGGGNGDNGD